MELNKQEVAIIEKLDEVDAVQTLNDLQLALVGGGMGDTIL